MSDKLREAFEAWSAEHEFLGVCPVERSTSGKYKDFDLQCAWETWQASRESLVIELPEPQPFKISAEESLDMDPDEFEALEARHGAQWQAYSKCKKAIEAAGIKCK